MKRGILFCFVSLIVCSSIFARPREVEIVNIRKIVLEIIDNIEKQVPKDADYLSDGKFIKVIERDKEFFEYETRNGLVVKAKYTFIFGARYDAAYNLANWEEAFMENQDGTLSYMGYTLNIDCADDFTLSITLEKRA
jgi:hypothetical protein